MLIEPKQIDVRVISNEGYDTVLFRNRRISKIVT